MRGHLPLEAVYGARLALVRPTLSEVDALGGVYVDTLAPGASDAVSALRSQGVRVVLVSSGIRQSVMAVATYIGLADGDVHAVELAFDGNGDYAGFDRHSPLTVATGKRDIVASLALPRPILAVGDGITDLAMKEAVDAFAAFTGFETRSAVVAKADLVIGSFAELRIVVEGPDQSAV
jgi:phosphoserine phosphatase